MNSKIGKLQSTFIGRQNANTQAQNQLSGSKKNLRMPQIPSKSIGRNYVSRAVAITETGEKKTISLENTSLKKNTNPYFNNTNKFSLNTAAQTSTKNVDTLNENVPTASQINAISPPTPKGNLHSNQNETLNKKKDKTEKGEIVELTEKNEKNEKTENTAKCDNNASVTTKSYKYVDKCIEQNAKYTAPEVFDYVVERVKIENVGTDRCADNDKKHENFDIYLTSPGYERLENELSVYSRNQENDVDKKVETLPDLQIKANESATEADKSNIDNNTKKKKHKSKTTTSSVLRRKWSYLTMNDNDNDTNQTVEPNTNNQQMYSSINNQTYPTDMYETPLAFTEHKQFPDFMKHSHQIYHPFSQIHLQENCNCQQNRSSLLRAPASTHIMQSITEESDTYSGTFECQQRKIPRISMLPKRQKYFNDTSDSGAGGDWFISNENRENHNRKSLNQTNIIDLFCTYIAKLFRCISYGTMVFVFISLIIDLNDNYMFKVLESIVNLMEKWLSVKEPELTFFEKFREYSLAYGCPYYFFALSEP